MGIQSPQITTDVIEPDKLVQSREELREEVLHELRKAKVKDIVKLKMKLRQVTRTRLQAPTQQNLAQFENEITASIKVAEYELDLIEEEIKGTK